MSRKIFLLSLFLISSLGVIVGTNPENRIGNSKTDKAKSSAFTENKGQFRDQAGKPNPEVLYMADFGGMKVQLRKTGFSYETYQVKPKWVDPFNN